MANFWDRLKPVYERLKTQYRVPQGQPNQPPAVRPNEGLGDLATVSGLIAKAGAARVLIEIDYAGSGEREVEPYSFRGSLFYGWCMQHRKIHSFRLEKIRSVRITDHKFVPRTFTSNRVVNGLAQTVTSTIEF